MRIGIFDSGIGGDAVAATLRKLMPTADVISVDDHEHMPYGNRTEKEIIRLTIKAVKPLVDKKYDVIIIACNTATTVAISALRTRYPDVHIIGLEPMIKPAAMLTKTRTIAVCATPSTLSSKRYQELKRDWAAGIDVIEPDCQTWAKLIEDGKSADIDIDSVVQSLINHNVDVIVLGCTHYHWLKQRVINIAGPTVTILEPSDAIADRIKTLMS